MSAPLPEPAVADVETCLLEALRDRSDLVSRMAAHTAAAGGKRLRPRLCLLAGAFGRPGRHDLLARTAAALELLHLASLVHDDVVDHAPTRRGRPTVSALWGNGLAVLTGDFLFASAFGVLPATEVPGLIPVFAHTVRELSAGAIAELEAAGTLAAELEPYYDRIYRKTAVFVEAACRAGALAGGADHATVEALATYGRRVGLAFQIVDDLLDFTGDPAATGKPPGADLRGGIATLPMILGRRDPTATRLLARWFGRADAGDRAVRQVAEALGACGALAEAKRVATDLTEQGIRALQPLRGRGPVEALTQAASSAVERNR
ncbi:MAG TPA: polyprenyl synthetase family protein [Symbiobacteriaceae bacterium]|nr:polyprenyl synthetase family protein [Symbiobacteriaceae bacterium]